MSTGSLWTFQPTRRGLAIAVFERVTTRPAWRTIAMALRCKPDHATGSPDAIGASVPGFRVMRCVAPTEWTLEGEHLFSHYSLTFRITPLDSDHCRVNAESCAVFPGLRGAAYRALVIGTGGHVIGVRGILRKIKIAAEGGYVRIPQGPSGPPLLLPGS